MHCKPQYVGSELNFKQQFRIHKSDIKTNKDRYGTRSSPLDLLLEKGVTKICNKFTGWRTLMPKCDFNRIVKQLY